MLFNREVERPEQLFYQESITTTCSNTQTSERELSLFIIFELREGALWSSRGRSLSASQVTCALGLLISRVRQYVALFCLRKRRTLASRAVLRGNNFEVIVILIWCHIARLHVPRGGIWIHSNELCVQFNPTWFLERKTSDSPRENWITVDEPHFSVLSPYVPKTLIRITYMKQRRFLSTSNCATIKRWGHSIWPDSGLFHLAQIDLTGTDGPVWAANIFLRKLPNSLSSTTNISHLAKVRKNNLHLG